MALLTDTERALMRASIAGTFGDTLTIRTVAQGTVAGVRQAGQWTAGATVRGRLKARTPQETLSTWGVDLGSAWEFVCAAADASRFKANQTAQDQDGRIYQVMAARPPSGAGRLSGRVLLQQLEGRAA